MSKKALIGILVILAIALGLYFFMGQARGPAGNNETGPAGEEQNETENQNEGGQMSFADFIRRGGSYQCRVVDSADGSTAEGMVYISGDLIRTDFDVEADGVTARIHSIMRDGNSYAWTSESSTGVVVPIDDSEVDIGESTQVSFSNFDPNEVGEYDCEPWVVNNAVFTLPAGVEFIDFSDLLSPSR